MRHIASAIEAAIQSGAARLCHVWLIKRRDGVTLGFSDHDRAFTFLGVEAVPQSALTAGAAEAELGVGASSLSVAGIISADAISREDILAGLYDEAGVALYSVDWSAPENFVRLNGGRLTRLEIEGGLSDDQGRFIAHIEGLSARLQRVIGRRYTRLCDAALGDARCGLDPEALPASTCDKRYATCRDVFDNPLNFRGFPDLPGDDILSLYPRSGDVMSGGSRRQGAGR